MDEPAHYEIEVAEAIDRRWSDWFGGLDLVQGDSGGTIMRGEIADQAELFGVLYKVRDLALTLISLRRAQNGSSAPSPMMGESEQGTGTIGGPATEGR